MISGTGLFAVNNLIPVIKDPILLYFHVEEAKGGIIFPYLLIL